MLNHRQRKLNEQSYKINKFNAEFVEQEIIISASKEKGEEHGKYKVIGTRLGIMTCLATLITEIINSDAMSYKEIKDLLKTVKKYLKDSDKHELK